MVRVFRLMRTMDETGVSGTGIVAYGCVFPNGKAVLAWHVEGRPQSVAVYDCLDGLLEVHVRAHPDMTRLEWLNG